MEKKSLYIVVAIVIVAALVIAVSNFTGQSVLGKCKDSDNGDNPEVPGAVSYEKSDLIYKDECYAEASVGVKKFVKERFCLEKMSEERYNCFKGCSENADGEGYCNAGGYDLMVED